MNPDADPATDPATVHTTAPQAGAVLVTGAARRIGREIALELARAGFDIGLHCHTATADSDVTSADIRALGRRVVVLEAELGDETEVLALIPRLVVALGPVRAVINNASIFEFDDATSFGHETLDRHMRVNLAAPVLLAQALHAHTPDGDAGEPVWPCVVNIIDNKVWNPNPDFFSYSCSKFALEGATRMLAQALAPRVRVVGVAPGVTLLSGKMSDASFDEAHAMTPLRRSSTPADIARAVRFAIESPAITGTTLLVDGGQHLWPSERDVAFKTSVR
jgi:NAD(P)-dependent dehydrogenase (short-subunit alcohol dehydrogenase family)